MEKEELEEGAEIQAKLSYLPIEVGELAKAKEDADRPHQERREMKEADRTLAEKRQLEDEVDEQNKARKRKMQPDDTTCRLIPKEEEFDLQQRLQGEDATAKKQSAFAGKRKGEQDQDRESQQHAEMPIHNQLPLMDSTSEAPDTIDWNMKDAPSCEKCGQVFPWNKLSLRWKHKCIGSAESSQSVNKPVPAFIKLKAPVSAAIARPSTISKMEDTKKAAAEYLPKCEKCGETFPWNKPHLKWRHKCSGSAETTTPVAKPRPTGVRHKTPTKSDTDESRKDDTKAAESKFIEGPSCEKCGLTFPWNKLQLRWKHKCEASEEAHIPIFPLRRTQFTASRVGRPKSMIARDDLSRSTIEKSAEITKPIAKPGRTDVKRKAPTETDIVESGIDVAKTDTATFEPTLEEMATEVEKDTEQLHQEFTEWDCSKLYLKAITDNPTINLHVAKAMTIGPPRVGKTSLRHLLLEIQPPEVIPSTPLMKMAETVSMIRGAVVSSEEQLHLEDEAKCSDSELARRDHGELTHVKSDMFQLDRSNPWLLVNEASGIHSLLRYLQQQVEIAATEGAAKGSEGVKGSEMVKGSNGETAPGFQREESNSEVGAKIYQLLQNPSIPKAELANGKLLQFLDCGGQLSYHDILPVFTTIPAVYLHVFNLNENLCDRPIDKVCFNQEGGEVCGSAESPLTIAEMMTRSVMTVNSLKYKKMQLPEGVLQSEPPEPRVVLVGTHLDKLAEKCEGDIEPKFKSVNLALKDALGSDCLKEMMVRNQKQSLPATFFPVGRLSPEQGKEDKCSQITRHSICELKHKIEELVSAVRVKVPVKWYLHQLLEISCSQEGHKPVHRYSDLYRSCLRELAVSDVGEFYAMVTYFHALGLLIHLCSEDVPHNEESACLVFTNPSYLFENITKLYRVQFMEKDRCEGSLRRLKCKGRLTRKALQVLGVDDTYLSHDEFMNLLVQLFIGADVNKKEHMKGGRVLFVPSVIPAESQHTVITKPSCPYFIITFKSKLFIPCGVFMGAIARLQSIPDWNLCDDSISRQCGKFSVGAFDTVYISDNSTYIKVAVDARDQQNTEKICDNVTNAVAQSYCFLFHSKMATKQPHCRVCEENPFLILGLLCRCTACAACATDNFAPLHTTCGIPRTVRCQWSGDAEELCGKKSSVFWNITHYAVATDQRTKPCITIGRESQHATQTDGLPHASSVPHPGAAANPTPIETAPAVNARNIIKALKHRLDARWKHFGTFLGVDPLIMDAIEENRRGQPGDCMLELVGKWITNQAGTGTDPRTWQTVVDAVQDTGDGALAEELAQTQTHLPL